MRDIAPCITFYDTILITSRLTCMCGSTFTGVLHVPDNTQPTDSTSTKVTKLWYIVKLFMIWVPHTRISFLILFPLSQPKLIIFKSPSPIYITDYFNCCDGTYHLNFTGLIDRSLHITSSPNFNQISYLLIWFCVTLFLFLCNSLKKKHCPINIVCDFNIPTSLPHNIYLISAYYRKS